MKKILFLHCALLFLLSATAQTPVAYYPFNGNANDAIGILNGTVSGAVLSTDRFGNANSAYNFDGVDDFISTANLATNQIDNWAMTAWVKPSSISQNNGTIVLNGFDNGVTGNGYGMVMGDATHAASGNLFKGLLAGVVFVTSGFTFSTNNIWYHTAIVREAGITKLYFNGILSGTTSANIPNIPSGSLRIGSCTGIRFWNGAIDEVKIYNTALTAAQVLAEYSPDTYRGQFDNSVKMNGTTDLINCGVNAALNIPDNLTLEAWIKPTSFGLLRQIIHKGGTGANVDRSGYQLRIDGTALSFYISDGSSFASVGKVLSNNDLNKWMHIAGVYDGSSLKFYQNGILTGTNTIAQPISHVTEPMLIGKRSDGFNFEGNIDEVRIWNTARTQAQIVSLRNTQLAGTETGLTGYWDMNRSGQGAGLTVENKATVTGTALNGTTVGTVNTPIFLPDVTPQKPGSGNAISFDGSGRSVVIPDNNNLNFEINQNFTIDFWLKLPVNQNNLTNVSNSILEKYSGAAGAKTPYLFQIYNSSSGVSNGVFQFLRSDGATFKDLFFINANDNKWHHVAMHKEGNNLRLFKDGILQGSTTDFTSGTVSNTTNVLVGIRAAIAPLTGDVDEIRFWNTALTQSEIRDRMCKKITSSDALYSNLVAYYNFDESTGSTAFDGTANANDGTLTNSPTRVTSGAAIGNASSHDYVNSTKNVSLTHATGENLTVTSTSGTPDGMQVYLVNEKPGTLTGASGVGDNNKYFGVFQVNGTSPQYTAVYNYNGNPFVNPAIESQLRLNKRTDNAGTWSTLTDIPNEPANTIIVTGESTEYILGRLGGALPLNLISFTGSKQNNDVLLQWKTANEVNVKQFEVQRSENGFDFFAVSIVTAGRTGYSFSDINTFITRSVVYYRLKAIDADGKFTYSGIVKLSSAQGSPLIIFPNPVKEILAIGGLKLNGTLRLFTTEGKLLQQQIVTTQSVTMDMSGYAKGTYLLQYENEGTRHPQKIIKL
jgi:Concanavalin A-like lectin/glucanases superfamily/Secretion system C-terminal sorting domain